MRTRESRDWRQAGGLGLVLCLVLIGAPGVAMPAVAATPERFVRDTIYHAVIDLNDSTIHVAYGSFTLVDCRWHTDDMVAVTRFESRWLKGNEEWRFVTGRRLWSATSAVSLQEVTVVAEVTHADPSLIQRVLPDRFTIDLAGGFYLQVMTPPGASQPAPFREQLTGWIRFLNPWTGNTTLSLIVSPEDAQTLYYALEPGTPVIIRGIR